ncbi:MAG: hypothetical protein KOO62_03480 [candidate division Zixibacteria bacterium]|nr:hypothetical protein [candidate division Zixibacteria bacterium]
MSAKLNCWQFMNCGCEKDGLLVDLKGECPVSTAMKYDGLNGGIGAGRACWMVPDSICRLNQTAGGRPCQCHSCEFYQRVVYEEDKQVRFRFSGKKTPSV